MRAKSNFDYLVVGGGTSGSIIARRLAEDRDTTACLLEAGPSDEGDRRILELHNWPKLLGSEFDYDYAIEPQPWGNSQIRHSCARVLGGCSSHNSAIAFLAPEVDLRAWEHRGAAGWGPEDTRPYFQRVLQRVHLEAAPSTNACASAFVEAAQQFGLPLVEFAGQNIREGVGWFRLNKRGPIRQSSSVAYLHSRRKPRNLTVLTETPVFRVLLDDHRNATAVETTHGRILAEREIIVCCGAFNTPKLLLLSGIGPAKHLRDVGVPVVVDLPGVGERLLDHPEGIILWEAARPVPEESTQFWEVGLFVRTERHLEWPDLMFHFSTTPFDINTKPLGYPTTEQGFCMTPNVTRPRSVGHVRLRSSDPTAPPIIDPRYFTDPEGYDAQVLLAGLKIARRIAEQPALRPWIKHELAPGLVVQKDDDLCKYMRRTYNTVYHPAGTCRMGSPDDSLAVVDPQLRVRGVGRLRIADASIFPTMIGVNPCLTCMMIGEKCADLVQRPTRYYRSLH